MRIPLDVTVRGMAPSESVADRVRQRALSLERYSKRILRCEVWIDADRGHHRKGSVYGVRIRLTVPDRELLVDEQPRQEDIHVAIRQAFDAIRREVEDYERSSTGRSRRHGQGRRRPQADETSSGPAEESAPGS